MLIVALLCWLVAFALLVFSLRVFIKNKNIIGFAAMLILVPQVFLRPLIFLAGLDKPFPYDYFDDQEWGLMVVALMSVSAWILIFLVAHTLGLKLFQPVGAMLPSNGLPISKKKLLVAVLVTSLIGIALTAVQILNEGSVAKFMFAVKVAKDLSGSYIIREICVIGAVFSILGIILCSAEKKPDQKGEGRQLVLLFSLLLIINLMFNYFWGNRYNIAMLVFALGLAWHLNVKKLKFSKIVLYGLVAAVALQGLKVVRNAAVEQAVGHDIVRDHSFWLDISTSLHLNQFDALMLALRDAGERFSFRDGRDFLNGLLSWIPRSLYPEKETFHIGSWFRRVYQPDVVNGWPITTMGGWYVNFGVLGIFLGSAFSGVVSSVFDSAYRRPHLSAWQAAIGACLAFLMFDGGVGPGFVQKMFLVLIPVYGLAFFLRAKVAPTNIPVQSANKGGQ